MRRMLLMLASMVAFCAAAGEARAQRLFPSIFPEARTIQVRDPSEIPRYLPPVTPPPATVSRPSPGQEVRYLSLDDAIQIGLINANAIRVLTGVTAVSSGQTIYEPAITNTTIDVQRARFDPVVNASPTFNHLETPNAVLISPAESVITGTTADSFNLNANVQKQNVAGGNLRFDVNTNPTTIRPDLGLPLNPSNRSSNVLSYTQPLLQGARIRANMAPIVAARINTEQSYFQVKDALQEMVRGVVEAYWALVFARADAWARERQVEQAAEAVRRIKARVAFEIDNRADLAQAEVTLANFKANLIGSRANQIQREAALRNILGLPPSDGTLFVPISPPTLERLQPEWEAVVELAAVRRPDIIELKLILEADEQFYYLARNNALPRADAVALYRWNGLEGEMPNGNRIRSGPGEFTDWTLGVNFSVPVGLRQSRAVLRQRELLMARDRANIQQGLHAAIHTLATNVRSIDQAYEQYNAFKESRAAARTNLDYQIQQYRTGRAILINVLQAITDWGNSISNEANSLTQYNMQLANLERQTGTILETHGVVLAEERYGSIGPLGRLFHDQLYPESIRPTSNEPRYRNSTEPAEQQLELDLPRGWRDLPPQRLPATEAEEIPQPGSQRRQ